MDYDEELDKTIVLELDGLIKLAEESVNKIDLLTAAIDKVKVYFSILIMLSTVVLGALAGFWFDVNKNDLAFLNASPAKLLVLVLGSSMVLGVLWAVISRRLRYRILTRELFAEKDVHERLITLIHEQTQRVAHRRAVSPVTFAMLEIRIRRLMR